MSKPWVVKNYNVEGVIGLNGFDYLLDGPDGDIMRFETEDQAIAWLEDQGVDLEEHYYICVEKEDELATTP